MTARVLTGSKQEIATMVAGLEGDVREAIVFLEDPVTPSTQPVPETVEELFAEMASCMVNTDHFDDSRDAIYEPGEGE